MEICDRVFSGERRRELKRVFSEKAAPRRLYVSLNPRNYRKEGAMEKLEEV
jgi:hypothetical protein